MSAESNKIRAICTDIDGTLLNKERQLSERTIATVRRLGGNFPFILASSRMPSAMRHLQRELHIEDHPIIAYNGGYVLRDGRNLSASLCSIEIPASIVKGIVSLSAGTSIHNSLYQDDNWFAPAMDQWTEREERITKVQAQIADLGDVILQWELQQRGAHKVMCMGVEREIHQLENDLQRSFGEQIHIYRSRPTYLELAPKSVSKASGLAVLLSELYDFPMENVLSFGDNYNDIEMLSKSGMGIAVDNARPEVKAVANEVTGKSVDDGVAIAIERYCFHRENDRF
jgi:Cof subfamily protein (haloacid dehalogenase superfamily)